MEKPTEIYRFGHYVNTVPDNKESLRQWIMDMSGAREQSRPR